MCAKRRRRASCVSRIFFGGVSIALIAEFAIEPGTGVVPIANGGCPRDSEHGGGLLNGESGEVSELHEFRLDGLFLGETLKGVVQGQEVVQGGSPGFLKGGDVLQIDPPE